MPFLTASADILLFASTLLVVVFSRLCSRLSVATLNHKRPRFRSATSTAVVLHTLYVLYFLCFSRPPDLFSYLRIPLETPSEKIRFLIIKRGDVKDGPLPDHLERLLTRLSSFDVRSFYVRFGPEAIGNCDHCDTFGEYALYAFFNTVLLYLREAAVIGLVTIQGTHREKWRMHGMGLLVFAIIAEMYWSLSVKIQIPAQGTSDGTVMWHDIIWTIRNLLFLFLPLTIHFLCPPLVSVSPLATAPTTHLALQTLLRRIQLLKFTHEATMRVPEFRQTAGEVLERQRIEGQWAREDENVNQTAEFAGVAIQREKAKQVVAEIKEGFQLNLFVKDNLQL